MEFTLGEIIQVTASEVGSHMLELTLIEEQKDFIIISNEDGISDMTPTYWKIDTTGGWTNRLNENGKIVGKEVIRIPKITHIWEEV